MASRLLLRSAVRAAAACRSVRTPALSRSMAAGGELQAGTEHLELGGNRQLREGLIRGED